MGDTFIYLGLNGAVRGDRCTTPHPLGAHAANKRRSAGARRTRGSRAFYASAELDLGT
jgi:hypothetical protein